MQENMFSNAIKIITAPSAFYKAMQREGGYVEPTIFVLAMGFVAALFFGLADLWAVGFRHALATLMQNIIIFPLVSVFCVAVASVLFYLLWKSLGGMRDFETAFRCTAYVAAITPLYAIAEHLHYIFVVAAVLWAAYILSVASDEVHSVSKKYATIVFFLVALIVLWRVSYDSSNESVENTMKSTSSDPALKEVVSDLLGENKAEELEGGIIQSDAKILIEDSVLKPLEPELDRNETKLEPSESGVPKSSEVISEKTVKQVESLKSNVETTGEALGNLVKEAGETVTILSEELVNALDIKNGSSESETHKDAEKLQSESKAEQSSQSVNSMTPEQLGEAIGGFIQKLQSAAEGANKAFEAGVSGSELEEPNHLPSEQAGQALGEFIKGFNSAMEGLEHEQSNGKQ